MFNEIKIWARWGFKFAVTLAAVIALSAMTHGGILAFFAWTLWVLWGLLMSNPMKYYGRALVGWLFRLVLRRPASTTSPYAGLDDKDVQRAETADRALTNWEQFNSTVGLGIAYTEQVEMRSGIGRKELVEFDALATPTLYEHRDTPYGYDLVVEVMGDRGQTVEDVQRASTKLAAYFGEKVIVTPDPERPHARAVIQVHLFDALEATTTAGFADWFENEAPAAEPQSTGMDGWFEK